VHSSDFPSSLRHCSQHYLTTFASLTAFPPSHLFSLIFVHPLDQPPPPPKKKIKNKNKAERRSIGASLLPIASHGPRAQALDLLSREEPQIVARRFDPILSKLNLDGNLCVHGDDDGVGIGAPAASSGASFVEVLLVVLPKIFSCFFRIEAFLF